MTQSFGPRIRRDQRDITEPERDSAEAEATRRQERNVITRSSGESTTPEPMCPPVTQPQEPPEMSQLKAERRAELISWIKSATAARLARSISAPKGFPNLAELGRDGPLSQGHGRGIEQEIAQLFKSRTGVLPIIHPRPVPGLRGQIRDSFSSQSRLGPRTRSLPPTPPYTPSVSPTTDSKTAGVNQISPEELQKLSPDINRCKKVMVAVKNGGWRGVSRSFTSAERSSGGSGSAGAFDICVEIPWVEFEKELRKRGPLYDAE
jgi:hypothetical protein